MSKVPTSSLCKASTDLPTTLSELISLISSPTCSVPVINEEMFNIFKIRVEEQIWYLWTRQNEFYLA